MFVIDATKPLTSKTGGTADEGGGADDDTSGAEKEGEKVGRASDPNEPVATVGLPDEFGRGGLGPGDRLRRNYLGLAGSEQLGN